MNIIYKMVICFYMFFLILKSVFCSDGEGLYKTVLEENVYSDIFKALYCKNTHTDLLKKYPSISDMVREKVKEVSSIDETSEELIRLSFFYKSFMTLLQCSGCKKSASSCRYCVLNKNMKDYFKVEGDAEHVFYDENAMDESVNFDMHKLQYSYLCEQFYNPERGKNTEKMNAAQLLFIEKNSPLNYFEKFCVKSKIDKMQKFGTYIMQGENIDVTNYKDLSTSDMLDVSDDVINSLIIDEFKEDGTHLLFPKMCEIFMAEKLFETAAKNDMSILKNTCYNINRVLKALKKWKEDDFSAKSLQNMIKIVNNVRSEEMNKEKDEEIDIDNILSFYEAQNKAIKELKEEIKQSNENRCRVNNINKNFKYLRCCYYALLVFICIVMIYKEKSFCEILAFPGVSAWIGLLSDFYFNYHRARPVKIELSLSDECSLYDLYHRLIPLLGFGLKKFEKVKKAEQKKNFKNITDILFGQEMKLRAWEYFDLDCGVWGSDAGQDKEAQVEKYRASERFKNIYSFTSVDYNHNQYEANFLNLEESDDTIKKNPDRNVLLCLEVLRAYNCFEAECSESEDSKKAFIEQCNEFFLEKLCFSDFIKWCNKKNGVCNTSQERVCSLHYKLKAKNEIRDKKEIRDKNYFFEENQNKHASSQSCWVIGEKCVLEFKDGERGKFNKRYFYNYKNVTRYWKPECQRYCVFDDECHNMFVYLVHKNKAYIYTTFSDGTPMSDESVKKLLQFIFETHMVTEIRAEYCNPNIFSDFYFMCGLENSISDYDVKKELDPEDSQIVDWPYSISVTYVISRKK